MEIKYITIVPSDNLIAINGNFLKFGYNVLPFHKGMRAIQYNKELETGEIEFDDDYNQILNAALYDEEVKPYVDLWIAQNKQIEEEEQLLELECNNIENVKARKLEELNTELVKFKTNSNTNIYSSLGFSINANDTARMNVDNLISYMELTNTDMIDFMTFDNTQRTLLLKNLKTIKIELSEYIQALYNYKWNCCYITNNNINRIHRRYNINYTYV